MKTQTLRDGTKVVTFETYNELKEWAYNKIGLKGNFFRSHYTDKERIVIIKGTYTFDSNDIAKIFKKGYTAYLKDIENLSINDRLMIF